MGKRGHRLTATLILAWADAHCARTRCWPRILDGDAVSLPPGESWRALDIALRKGLRGLPGGDSLPRLLRSARGVRPPLTESMILRWADEHHARMGRWPTPSAGPVPGVPDQTWAAVHMALVQGSRGLPGGDSLSRLLRRHGRGAGSKPNGRPANRKPKGPRHRQCNP
jgi:hypothetical protein